MPSKDGWNHNRDHDKIRLGRKEYRNMEEWTRPCAVCGEAFSIFVRANGNGLVNSSFGLRTCQKHRGEKPGVGGVPAPGEFDALRTANATMREELDGLYVRLREVFEELQVCKAKLSAYELQPAMAAIKCEAVQKLPWEL